MAAEEASAGIQTVAAAADELTSSIQEISRQVAQSAKITGTASEQVLGAASDLSQQAKQITTEVETFVAGLRAA